MAYSRIMAAAVSLAVSSAGLTAITRARCRLAARRLDKGDHICLIGNSLPDTMEHDGFLETNIVSLFPAE